MITKYLNHNTYVKDVWVDYNGWRFKDFYEIELHNESRVVASPNGNGWYPIGNTDEEMSNFVNLNTELVDKYGSINIRDEDVKRIRLLTDLEVKERTKYGFTGRERDARNIRYFGYGPDYNYTENKFFYRFSPIRINDKLVGDENTLVITKYVGSEVIETLKKVYDEDFKLSTLDIYAFKDHEFRSLIDAIIETSIKLHGKQSYRNVLANVVRRFLNQVQINEEVKK